MRVDEYRERFAEIAKARAGLARLLRVSDGQRIDLGAPREFDLAADAITGLTGGSSFAGRWSFLWGLLYARGDVIAEPKDVERIAWEAADFLNVAGTALDAEDPAIQLAQILLRRLAAIPHHAARE